MKIISASWFATAVDLICLLGQGLISQQSWQHQKMLKVRVSMFKLPHLCF
jgi:hypothetical protein